MLCKLLISAFLARAAPGNFISLEAGFFKFCEKAQADSVFGSVSRNEPENGKPSAKKAAFSKMKKRLSYFN
ncbi:hypothetical protein [Rufibacter sp. LB8]|uniref:hypothetical protein n=1 Tax=Rufibacter sp. LB8 TaxID=2777781 RepID=UPI00178C6AFB|nr:hypothetical protein [Rufibacter sp. LB8]